MSFVDDIAALVATSKNPLINSPSSWLRVPLGRVAEIVNGYPFASNRFNRDIGHPVARIRDVLRGRSETFYDGPEESAALIANGDLLVGMDGDFNSAVWRGGRALLNQRVCKVVPDESRLHPGYLRHILPGYLQLINDNTPSTTVKHLSSRTLAAVPIPLPELTIQEQIAARIDELFTDIDDGEEELRRARLELETYRKSLLNAAVTGELTAEWRANHNNKKQTASSVMAGWPSLPGCWCYRPLETLLSSEPGSLTDGPFGSKLKTEHYRPSGPRVIRLQNIGKHGQFVDEKAHISYEHFDSLARHHVMAGDLAVAILGDVSPRAVIVPADLGPALVKADCFKVRFGEDLDRTYAWAWLNSGIVQSRLSAAIKGVGRPRIGMKDIRHLPVPVPPLAEQRIIVKRLTSALTEKSEAERMIGEIALQSRDQRQSILAAAFRGELIQ